MRAAAGKEWSNSKFAARIGFTTAVVSQYLNEEGNKYSGDSAKLERRISDWFRNESRRRASGITTAQCDVSKEIRTALEFIRRTNTIGEIFAESGSGNASLGDARVQRANIHISGSGDVDVTPREEANVHVSGSGNIRMKAMPARLNQKVSGSGGVRIAGN